MYNPSHPGLVLREYLENISVTEAAQRLGITPPPYRAFSTAKRPSVQKWQFARRFCLIPDSQMRLNMQAAYDLWQAGQRNHDFVIPLSQPLPT